MARQLTNPSTQIRRYNRLRPVSARSVQIQDAFWSPRIAINRSVTLPSQFQQCEETGRVDNFRRASGKKEIPFEGIFFNDSDVYKLLEAMAFALGQHPDDEALIRMADVLITEIADAQDANGYLNTYFSVNRVGERWTNLKDMHELYCAGHLIQAAAAHFDATESTRLLDVAKRLADHICETFGPVSEGKREGACGHEEIELALAALYKATGNDRYLNQVEYFLGARGQEVSALYTTPPTRDFDRRYFQDQVPFRDLTEVVGHSVRQMYLDSGAADLYAETGDASLLAALEAQWRNMTERRMYVTGGLGARWEGEAFGADWELPSDRAYAETCAAIGGVMWNWRMLQIAGDAKYADQMELQLYNAMLAGLSLDGASYFYQNPLSNDGSHRRQPWFGCACCPPNIARLLASLSGYFYSVDDSNGVWAHLYAAGSAELPLQGGGSIALKQETIYPWDGDIRFTVENTPHAGATLHLRIPEWAQGATVQVNGEAPRSVEAGAYAAVDHPWTTGDTVRLTLPMPVRALTADPRIADAYGKTALARGPLVYCLEQIDHDGVDVRDIVLSDDAIGIDFQKELLGGVTVLRAAGNVLDRSAWAAGAYLDRAPGGSPGQAIAVTAVPYYAWANREAGSMTVWVRKG
ncbi:hypothetical protein CCAX7_36770 [Capsulimonas corticalis]|uniref:Glycoside hydrolase family 127 protein n=1 Tax=Capsulimonas corticalis TaxID=2219043 RepID=A0A9N7QCA9_9BACT|nr:beta-L-arabinofuranosidase domain-containing protein [Capsulimonas corticalis]BDI31626.1 hypothetical protein CCAX7_36770 [Capsulimonas corticalis]